MTINESVEFMLFSANEKLHAIENIETNILGNAK